MMRVLFLLFLVFTLAACQTVPATVPATAPTETPRPRETVPPVPTATPVPVSAPVTSPTISADPLRRQASPVCDYVPAALVETGPFKPPFAVMKKTTYADAPSWELSHQLPHMGSFSASEVKTLFCIFETRAQAGTYTDGSPAYQLFWEVWAVSWPDGRVVGKSSFTGSAPPGTKLFASGSADGSFPYAEFAAWVFHRVDHPEFIHFNDAVTTIATAPNRDMVAFGSAVANQMVDRNYQAKIFLFRTSDMQIISATEGHQGMVTSLAFSPDGRILASSGYDLFVKFWDVGTSRLLGQVNIADTPNSLTFSPDGRRLAVASNLDVTLIDVPSMQIQHSLQEATGKDLAYSPDGSQVYVNSLGSIKVIDPSANIVMLTFPDTSILVPTLSLSADGSVVGATYETPDKVDGFALYPDGTKLITYTVDRSIENDTGTDNVRLATWDANTGKYVDEIKFSGDLIQALEFSPDGELVAVGNGSEIWVWNTTDWQVNQILAGHSGEVVDLAFTYDGTSVISAGSDGTVRVWTLEE